MTIGDSTNTMFILLYKSYTVCFTNSREKSTSFELYNHDRMSLCQLFCLSLRPEFVVSLQLTV